MAYSGYPYVPSGSAQPQPGVGYGQPQRRPNYNDPFQVGGGYGIGGTGYGGEGEGAGYTTPKATTTPQWDNDGRLAWENYPWDDADAFDMGIFNNPGYDEQWYLDNKGQFGGKSAAELYWEANNGAFAAGPERSVGAKKGYDAWFEPLYAPGFTEAGAAAGPRGTNYTGGAYGGRTLGGSRSAAFEAAGGPMLTNYGGAAYAGGAGGTTFNSGLAFDRFFEPLAAESFSEQIYGTDPGLDNYYNRAAETGSERIRNTMAARGLFGSGAALDEERELYKDLGAEQANREASYRLQAAGQADSERRVRMSLAGQLGSASDSASVARSANARDWTGMLDDLSLSRARERRAGREFADTEDRLRDRQTLDWTSILDDQSLDRSRDAREWAVAGDEARLNRSGEARSWTDLLGDETDRNNQSKLDFLDAGRAAARDSDDSKITRLREGRLASESAQDSLTKRYNDQFANLMRLAEAKAGIVSGAVDAATKQKVDTLISQLKARLAAATNGADTSAENQQKTEELLGELATLLGNLK